MDSKEKSKKSILITGAAGGLGAALCLEYYRQGWRVIATDLKPEIPAQFSDKPEITWYPMDVTSEESVQRVADDMTKKGIRLDTILDNAGIDRYMPFSEATTAEFQSVYEVNLFGVYRVNRAFLPLLLTPGGTILIISSESVNLTVPFLPYPLTKKAVEGYAKALRQELGFLGISVTMVRPGPIETELLNNVNSIDYPVRNEILAKAFRQFAKMAPLNVGKRITPEAAADFIFRISKKKKPAVIYRLNNDPKLRIAALLPFCLQEKIVTAQLRAGMK